ncbi:Polyhydroxyalkanoic acid synthase [Marinobacterium lacunae]|uniref:Polyhydroxyalkanoic acid synthase n=1 Tax=Marinobacterium lacunae TaxID=1232683 RepID=A0A081FW56_9GAMM|nr:alpha/beta fold hydrolase [Marinobacterium lacunae]KEA62761.1 Polyhydroxyalkanoic acid synthase [Marinobacterium lacunae]
MTHTSFTELKNSVDRVIHALEGRLTQGISPASLTLAYLDWLIHLAHSPGKMSELAENMLRKHQAYQVWSARAAVDPQTAPLIEPRAQDRRFNDPAWAKFPFNAIAQGFLLHEQWWHYATTGIPGVSKHHENVVHFAARQWLDMLSPTNFMSTNPKVINRALETGGNSLYQGMQNLLEDLQAYTLGAPPDCSEYCVGRNLAATEGQVVYKNNLIELIQYSPKTQDVYADPILIVPAWIMKYYILDLSEHNSMVRYLVEQGHTVFMISWHNPDAEDRDLAIKDYINRGVRDALKAITAIVPNRKVHAAGYCLGGTLLATTAAAMARDEDDRLGSMSLFTAQTDFTEAGELMLFIDESQLSYMEDMMWDRGYLDTSQMAGAFTLLRSYDLLWSRIVSEYLLGECPAMSDLMAWNSDSTRMPYKMHTQYLRKMFLNNDLASGRFIVDDRPISLRDIRVPIFCVATETDHVAPWRSVYKLHSLVLTDLTFVLTSGGHNAGIVSEPGHPRRSYRMALNRAEDKYIAPDEWLNRFNKQDGSWWEPWSNWLSERSGPRVEPPAMGNPEAGYAPICPAPGQYVFEK